MDEYLRDIAVPQVKEILTKYGPHPRRAVVGHAVRHDPKERADMLIPLLKLQPGIIHNNRLGGGYPWRHRDARAVRPATGYPDRDWETCMTMNDTWGFKSYDHNWKSTETLVRTPDRHRQQGRQLPAQRRPHR
jgi:alpha-L-fucosidase